MSSLPDIHTELLAQIAPHLGMSFRQSSRGCVLERGGQAYRFEAFDGFVSGSVLRAACVWLEVDPSTLADAITRIEVSG